ncbi:MAG: hypothetical protein AVDCRST_MAG19-1989 [uncultured Thermomicrobiales bacterium]|uniref:Uncharacterized protein n=1 Tax=uncultured Thermomicrobiales bacterium TaxID=1645740 RepID=A0A6J4UZP0_9BACT|nr:MAG: hypothetical protein AVDCRST_MAG19-1989 [uncultured Thermomicrobiales bacterium]
MWECHSLSVRHLGTVRAWSKEILGEATLIAPTDEDDVVMRRLPGYPAQRITLLDAVLAVVSDRLRAAGRTFDHPFDVMGSTVRR